MSSPQTTSTLKDWLETATRALKDAAIENPRLDAELILAHSTHYSREFIHAHPEQELSELTLFMLEANLNNRINHVPLAYITLEKEFYGRSFIVSPFTLIPRPETEDIIDIVKELHANHAISERPTIFDIGTGSGCIAVTLAYELERASVEASDISTRALKTAKQNAKKLFADIAFHTGSLLEPYVNKKADVITANLPYVDRSWDIHPDTQFEPHTALFAEDDGLALIYQLIETAPQYLNDNGYLLLESDPRQHTAAAKKATDCGFELTETRGFIQSYRRV